MIEDQWSLGFSLCLGAHVIMSSTRIIISAASLAEIRACSLDLKHSVMDNFSIDPTKPVYTLMPDSGCSLNSI
jgi:hypothetical protein